MKFAEVRRRVSSAGQVSVRERQQRSQLARRRLWLESLEERSLLATIDLIVNLYQDNAGVPGALITTNTVTAGQNYFVEITAQDTSANPSGIIGLALDLGFSAAAFDEVDAPFDPANAASTIITADFPLFRGGTLDNAVGTIDELRGASLPNLNQGKEIGKTTHERFALLKFKAETAVTASPLTIAIGSGSVAFADGSSLTGTTIEAQTITVTPDTGPVPTLSIDDITANEGSDGTTTSFTFTVTLTPAATATVLVQVDTADGTAVAPGDYAAIAASVLTFAAGETSKTVTVKVVADKISEPVETFNVILSKSDGAVIGDGSGLGTILNDDQLTASITKTVTLPEGAAGTTDFDFTVTLDGAAPTDVVIPYTFAHVSTSDADFGAGLTKTGKVTIPMGQTSAKITPTFPVSGENIVELNETFTVTLGTPETAGVVLSADKQGTGTIQNDDTAAISIQSVSIVEGNAGTKNLKFSVALSNPVANDVKVDLATQDATATAGVDYTTTNKTLTFPANSTAALDFEVPISGDGTVELDETFSVLLSNLQAGTFNVTLPAGPAIGTIQNDDSATVTLNAVSQEEGNAGTKNMVFTATLSNPVDADFTVDFATSDGAATLVNNDYTETKQTLTFQKGGLLTQTINVPIVGDTTVETDEIFNVALSNVQAGGRNVLTGIAQTGTIVDDDSDIPVASIGDVTILEGDSGETLFVFTVTLTKASTTADVLLEVSTQDISALAGTDFTALTNQAVTIAKNTTSQTVTVKVTGETLVETDETFKLSITKIDGAKVGDGEAIGSITNDDTATASINSVTLAEGNAGTTPFDFTVTLDKAAQFDIVIPFTFTHVDTNDADFTAGLTKTGKVTVLAGQTSAKITPSFPVNGDATLEANEKFSITLGTPENSAIKLAAANTVGTGMINNDDQVTVSINSVTNTEPANGATKNFDFTVTLTQAADIDVVVPWTFTNVTTADADFGAGLTKSGKVTILAGQTSAQVTPPFPVAGDLLIEPDETFTVTLGTPETAGAILDTSKTVGIGTIVDTPPDSVIASIDSKTLVEGNAGTTNFDFTVTLDKVSPVPVVIPYTFAHVTTNAADFGAGLTTTGKVTIPANQLSAKITPTFPVNGDTLLEGNDTFIVTLGTPETTTASVNPNAKTGTGTITNDDQVTVSITEKVSQTEGNAATKDFDFTVTLDQAAGIDVVVPYTFAHVTSNDADFSAGLTKTGKVTILAGQTSAKVTPTFAVNGDTLVEGDETFTVTLTTPETTGAVLSATNKVGTGTIVNDDQITASIKSVAKAEGNAGTTAFDFEVSLDQAAAVDVVIPFTLANVTTADNDFGAGLTKTGKVTILAGQTTKNISFSVNGDTLVELDETFTVTLGTPETIGVVLSATAKVGTGTVQNDDTATASINDITLAEGNSGTTNFDFTVTLDKTADFNVTIPWTFANVTTKDADFGAALTKSGSVTILAGQTSAKVSPSFPVLGETTVEADETFSITLGTPDKASVVLSAIDKAGIGTITNDDATTITIGSAQVIEPGTGTVDITFPITLTQPVDVDTTVTFTLANTSTADADFSGLTKTGTVIIPAGQTTSSLKFMVAADAVNEPNETFSVTLSNPTFAGGGIRNVTIPTAGAVGTGTIQEDSGSGSLAGSVYVDTNKNGIRDANEIGVPGATITLTGTPTSGAAITLTAMTANDGTYSFTKLTGGKYQIAETQPATMFDGIDVVGTQGGTLGNDQVSNIVLNPGEAGTGNNFGELGLLPQFVTKRLFLASTPDWQQVLRVLGSRAAEIAGNQVLADQIINGTVPSIVAAPANGAPANVAPANNGAAPEFVPESAGEFIAADRPPAAASPLSAVASSTRSSTIQSLRSSRPVATVKPLVPATATDSLQMLAVDEVLSREKRWR